MKLKFLITIAIVNILFGCTTMNADLDRPDNSGALLIINCLSDAVGQYNQPVNIKIWDVNNRKYIAADSFDYSGNNYFFNVPKGKYKIGQFKIKAHLYCTLTFIEGENSKVIKSIQFDPTIDAGQSVDYASPGTFNIVIGPDVLEYPKYETNEIIVDEAGIYFLGQYKIEGKIEFPNDMLNLIINQNSDYEKIRNKTLDYINNNGNGWEKYTHITTPKIFKENEIKFLNK